MRLIDVDKLIIPSEEIIARMIIYNAPTVPLPDFEEGYKQAIRDGKTNFSRPQDKWSLVEYKKNIDLVCPCCGYHRCNLAYGFSIEEVREQIKENTSNDFLIPDFCERCGAKLGFGGNKE